MSLQVQITRKQRPFAEDYKLKRVKGFESSNMDFVRFTN